MRLIVCSSVFRHLHLPQHIHKFARESANSIEVWADGGHHFNLFDDREVNSLRIALQRNDVYACALHAPYGSQYDLSSLEHSQRQKAITAHRRAIEVADSIGATVVVMHAGDWLPDAALREDAFRASVDSITKLVEWAEKHNVILAVENLTPIAIGDSSFELFELLSTVSTDRLRICFDTGHANVSHEGLMQSLRMLAPHIAIIHWNDNDKIEDLHLPPGWGCINWHEFFDAVAALSNPQYISLEVRLPPKATLFGILRSAISLIPKM